MSNDVSHAVGSIYFPGELKGTNAAFMPTTLRCTPLKVRDESLQKSAWWQGLNLDGVELDLDNVKATRRS